MPLPSPCYGVSGKSETNPKLQTSERNRRFWQCPNFNSRYGRKGALSLPSPAGRGGRRQPPVREMQDTTARFCISCLFDSRLFRISLARLAWRRRRDSDFEFQRASFGPSRWSKRIVAECPPDRLAPSRRAAVSGAGKRYCRSKRLAEPQTRMEIQRAPEATRTTASTIAIFHRTGIGLRDERVNVTNGFSALAFAVAVAVALGTAGELTAS